MALLLVGVVGDAFMSSEAEGAGAVELVEIGGGRIPPKRPINGFLGPSMAEVAGEGEAAVGRFGVARL